LLTGEGYMFLEQIKVGFMEVFCYLVGCESTQKCLLIDPAGDEEKLVRRVAELGFKLEYIVNTHGHPDHTCGNARVKELTGARIIMHPLDDALFNSPEGQAMARQMGFRASPRADEHVEHGSVIKVGEVPLEVIHTPGHSPGGICLYCPGNVFTGDTLFVGAIGRTDLPGASMEQFMTSIRERLLTLPDETVVWPGHDYGIKPRSTIGEERRTNPWLR
jgi:glyoxylase-like metal-dependent hydrolase (beta-lactamase superfamily II)